MPGAMFLPSIIPEADCIVVGHRFVTGYRHTTRDRWDCLYASDKSNGPPIRVSAVQIHTFREDDPERPKASESWLWALLRRDFVLTGGKLALCGQESGGQNGLGAKDGPHKHQAWRTSQPAPAITRPTFISKLLLAFMSEGQ